MGIAMKKAVVYAIALMALRPFGAAAADDCDPIQTRVSTTPVIAQSPWRLNRAIEVQRPQVPNTDLLLIGDSLIQQWQKRFNVDFPGRAVHNFGVAGDRTQELLWRLQNLKPDVSPREIIVLVGTNNLTDKTTTACGVSNGIEAVVDEIGRQWPNAFTFLVEILPRGEGFDFRNQDRREANDKLAKHFAGSKSVAFVKVDEDRLTCSWNSYKCPMFRPDLIHLKADGYVILRDALRRASLSLFNKDRLERAAD